MTAGLMTVEMARKTVSKMLPGTDVTQMDAEKLKGAVQEAINAGKCDPLTQKLLVALKVDLDREFPARH